MCARRRRARQFVATTRPLPESPQCTPHYRLLPPRCSRPTARPRIPRPRTEELPDTSRPGLLPASRVDSGLWGPWGRFDNLIANQPQLLDKVSSAMTAFYNATAELGAAVKVTAFTASDFGRTLTSNGDGSDHGWGSHHFVVGGAVRGATFYGAPPPISVGNGSGSEDQWHVGQGRLLPSTAVDSTPPPWRAGSACRIPSWRGCCRTSATSAARRIPLIWGSWAEALRAERAAPRAKPLEPVARLLSWPHTRPKVRFRKPRQAHVDPLRPVAAPSRWTNRPGPPWPRCLAYAMQSQSQSQSQSFRERRIRSASC